MSEDPIVRINVTMPKSFLEELKAFVPKGNVSKFLVEASKDRLAYKKHIRAIENLKKLPPAFPHIKDSAKYVHDMRRADTLHRFKKLGYLDKNGKILI